MFVPQGSLKNVIYVEATVNARKEYVKYKMGDVMLKSCKQCAFGYNTSRDLFWIKHTVKNACNLYIEISVSETNETNSLIKVTPLFGEKIDIQICLNALFHNILSGLLNNDTDCIIKSDYPLHFALDGPSRFSL
jgi:hypothetical protein